MSKGAQTFTQFDVTKAVKGAVKGGMKVARVQISRDGTIVIVAGDKDTLGDDDATGDAPNEWDSVT